MADATPLHGRWESVVYGPIRSRRLGNSLGLNLIPRHAKLCELDCPYCSCGFTTVKAADTRWPSPDEVAHQLLRALERLPHPPDWICFSGNGEPTLHPRFAIVVERVLAVRDAWVPDVRVAVLSNGLAAGRPPIRDALRRLDARIMKLDPGPRERVNGAPFDASRLAADYRALKPVTIQVTVVRGSDWDGSSPESLAAWLTVVRVADPDVVQLCSIDRPPADATVQNVPRERLLTMAATIREALPRSVVDVY
ncbi:MAG TPA: radical SAM protein [Gemmatimonadales bacterium]|nr:radical SAM protein [Gemmatimonadales bacterium]